VFEPDPREREVYERLFALYAKLYFALGAPGSDAVQIGDVLPELRNIARLSARGA
jgi:L-ribulokinase